MRNMQEMSLSAAKQNRNFSVSIGAGEYGSSPKSGARAFSLLLFLLGGVLYGLLELLWRGYTHVSMLVAGGVCILLLSRIAVMRVAFLYKCLLGGLMITGVEFVIGCVVNLWLGLKVWDYSTRPLHLFGQVCPLFIFLWCLVSAPVLRGFSWMYTRWPSALPKKACVQR